MNDAHDDGDLLRRLGDADAATPPPAALRITPMSLRERHRRRLQKRALLATLLLTSAGSAFALLRAPDDAPARAFAAELAELQAELRAVRARWQAGAAAFAAADEAAALRQLRTMVLAARADAALPFARASTLHPEPESRR